MATRPIGVEAVRETAAQRRPKAGLAEGQAAQREIRARRLAALAPAGTDAASKAMASATTKSNPRARRLSVGQFAAVEGLAAEDAAVLIGWAERLEPDSRRSRDEWRAAWVALKAKAV